MKKERSITKFALLRHAETEWNREKRIQGQQDAPLTSNGKRLAESWGRALGKCRLDYLLSSDLERATLTADLINQELKLPFSLEPRLREQDWGSWSGVKFSDLNADDLKAQEGRGWHFRPAGGENRLEVLGRSRQALVDTARRLMGHRILVVTHGGVIRCLLYWLYNRNFLPKEPPLLESYRLHWLSYDGEAFQVHRLNDEI